jgi:hypothetical protein
MATRMQQRRGTAAQWISTNGGDGPILNAGEIGYETDTNKFKVGDGTNHWVDLNYFLDAVALGGSIDDYIPLTDKGAISGVAALDASKNVIVPGASIIVEGTTDNNFETTITATDPTEDRTITIPNATGTVVLADGSGNVTVSGNLTVSGTTTTINSTTINATTGIVFEGTTANDFETTLTVTDPTADRTITFPDATGTVAMNGDLTTHTGATTNVHGIVDTTELATRANVASLLTNATKTNITITGDKDGLVITAENGVADSNTDNLSEGGTNKYFTDERAQDAIGLNVGTGLSYNDTTGAISVDTTTIQARVNNITDTEIGYLDGVTSAIQPQINDKLNSGTAATTYAPINSPAFTGTVTGVTKTHVGLSNVDNTSDAAKPVSTLTQTALNLKADLAGPTFTGTVVLPSTTSVGDVSATELGYVNGVTSAIQTQLDGKLALSGGTLTGLLTLSGAPTLDLHAATKQYVDGLAAGINFHQPVVAATMGNLAGTYNNGTNGVGATITAGSNGSIGTIDGASVSVGNRILLRAQTDAKQNGVYTVTAVGSAGAPWVVTRAADADNNPSGELANGDFTFVTSGSTNGSKGFLVSTTGTITIGTTEIQYAQFNASEAIIAGTGISKSGATISIDTAVTADLSTAQTLTNKTLTSPVVTTPTLTLSSTTSTTSGRIAFDATNDKIIVGDGTNAVEFAPSTTLINAQSASYTLVAADKDKMIEMGVGSANNLTVPLNATVPYAIGTKITVVQTGSGQTTIAPTGGVTINGTPGLKLRAQWSAVTLVKRAENTWVAFGDLTA